MRQYQIGHIDMCVFDAESTSYMSSIPVKFVISTHDEGHFIPCHILLLVTYCIKQADGLYIPDYKGTASSSTWHSCQSKINGKVRDMNLRIGRQFCRQKMSLFSTHSSLLKLFEVVQLMSTTNVFGHAESWELKSLRLWLPKLFPAT